MENDFILSVPFYVTDEATPSMAMIGENTNASFVKYILYDHSSWNMFTRFKISFFSSASVKLAKIRLKFV